MAIPFSAEEIARALTTELKKVRSAIGNEFVKDIVPRTPVRTGKARRNWQVNYGAPNGQVLNGVDKAGQNTIQNGLTRIRVGQDRNAFIPLIIENNVPYIERLNAGSSPQAPPNFVELSINLAVNRVANRREL